MPKTVVDAEDSGWVKINSECVSGGNGNTFAGYRYENPDDDGVVVLFDVNGVVAGIQARVSFQESTVCPYTYTCIPHMCNLQNISNS